MAKIPENFRDHHQIQPLHIAAQLRGIRCFAHQIEFVMQVFVKLRHDLHRLQALAVRRQTLHPARHHAHQAQVLVNDRQHTRTKYLHRHLAQLPLFGLERGEMHLRNRCTGYGFLFEAFKNIGKLAPKCALNRVHCYVRFKRRHSILKLCQFICNIRGQ